MTLLELMIASAIATIIALGLAMIEGSRARVHEDVRLRVLAEPERKNASLAAVRITKELETADRFERIAEVAPNWRLNVRLPNCATAAPTCFDNALNYQWVQYRLDTASRELRMYRFAPTASVARPLSCPARQVLAGDITTLAFPSLSTNLVTYQVTWTSGTRNHTFQGQVVTRFKPDQSITGTDTGLQGPGADISPPPGVACN